MNYIRVFLNSESEIKLKEEEKDLMNTVADVYTVCMNAAQNEKKTAEQSSAEKLIQNKHYWVTKTVIKKEKNYLMMKRQHIDQYKKVLTELLRQSKKPHSIIKIMLIEEDQKDWKNIITLEAASAKLTKSKVLCQKLSKILKKKINSYYITELML